MDTQIYELKYSLKTLIQNLLVRIDSVSTDMENNKGTERLSFLLEDLSILTESIMLLSEKGVIDIEIDTFNEKSSELLDKIEERDFLYVSDLLKYELKPLFAYWDECIVND